MEQVGVVVAHDDHAVVEHVAKTIERVPGLYVVATSAHAAERGQVVVVGGGVLWEADLPDRPLVVLAEGDLARAARAALAKGARDIVIWPGEADRLPGAIRRALAEAPAHGNGNGRAITVVGARGGVGASTLAAGVGAAFGEAVVIDLDPIGAGQRAFLAKEPVRTIEEMATGLLDVQADILQSALTSHVGRTRALHTSIGGTSLSSEAVRGLVRAARELTSVTVLDIGRAFGSPAAARAALSAADACLLMVANDVASMRGARTVLDRFPGRFEVVVRRERRSGVATRDIATALGRRVLSIVPNDPVLARAVDLGGLPSRPTRAMHAFAKTARALEEVWREI
jgi:Flp pilus assembly CpaE family ATPase